MTRHACVHRRIRTLTVTVCRREPVAWVTAGGLSCAQSKNRVALDNAYHDGTARPLCPMVRLSPTTPVTQLHPIKKFLVLTGEPITACQAERIGLVLKVEPDGELFERTQELTRRISRLPREALTLNKRSVDSFADASGETASRLAARGHDALTLSHSPHAKAADGRTFTEIQQAEGVEGMKKARQAQYASSRFRPEKG